MNLTPEEKRELFHHYTTIGLVVNRLIDELTPEERALVSKAFIEIRLLCELPVERPLEIVRGGTWPEVEPGYWQNTRNEALK